MASVSGIEAELDLHFRSLGLQPEREYRFHDVRRWRFDFAFPARLIAIECEGGHWTAGRHTRGKGFEQDCEKYNTAQELGWRIFRYTARMVRTGEAIAQLERILAT